MLTQTKTKRATTAETKVQHFINVKSHTFIINNLR